MNDRRVFYFNIVYIAILIVWSVLKSFYLHVDMAGRAEIIITILAILINNKRLLAGPFAMKIWILWVIYSIINSLIKGFHVDNSSLFMWSSVHLVTPLIAMLVTYWSVRYNYSLFIKWLYYFFLFFVIVGSFNIVAANDASDRYSNSMGNYFFNVCVLLVTFISLHLHENRKDNISIRIIVILLMAYLLFGLVLSGERKALFGLLIIIFGYYLARNSKMGFLSILAMITVLITAYFVIPFIMENTLAGQRQMEQMEEVDITDNYFLKLLGNRSIFYIEGFGLFLEHPLTGIGLTNYKFMQYGSRYVLLHTEYIVQLAECGIIGALLFLYFIQGMVSRLIMLFKNKNHHYEFFILSFSLLAILEMALSAWTYDVVPFFILYGILYARCDTLNSTFDKLKIKGLLKGSSRGRNIII